jgi:hypothetical protein
MSHLDPRVNRLIFNPTRGRAEVGLTFKLQFCEFNTRLSLLQLTTPSNNSNIAVDKLETCGKIKRKFGTVNVRSHVRAFMYSWLGEWYEAIRTHAFVEEQRVSCLN